MFSWTTVNVDFTGEEVKEAMEGDGRDHLRRVLKEQSANADRLRWAYTRASEDRERLNSILTLVALLASALTGTTALWAALGDTVIGSGAWVGGVVLWAIAATGFVTTVSTTLQKTKWGSADLIKRYRDAAGQYWGLSHKAAHAAESNELSEKELLRTLREVERGSTDLFTTSPSLPKKHSPEDRKEFQELDRLHKAGLADVLDGRQDIMEDYFRSEPRRVQILETWTGFRSQLKDWITEAVENGAEIEILLLDPTSPQVRFRNDALEHVANVHEEITLDLKTLGNVLSELEQNSNYKGKLRIRLYNANPVVSMYRFDDTWIIAPYLWGTDSIMGPQFKIIEGGTAQLAPLAVHIDKHFKNLWNKAARPVKVENGKLWTETQTEPLTEGEEEVKERIVDLSDDPL
jgi:hypothetical protein